mgnify:CR=1 FL=1
MINYFKYITKNTAIYSIGQLAPKLVGFILLPFVTNPKYLSAADYGKLSLLEASTLFLVTMFGFGLNYALERWYYDKEYINKRKSIIFTLLIAILTITAVLWGIISMFSGDISYFLIGKEDWSYMLNLLIICSAFESIILIPTTLLRLAEKPILFVSSSLIRFFIYLVFAIYFLVFRNDGLEGIYEARLFSLIAILLTLTPFIVKNISIRFEWSTLKEMLFFRLPLVLSSLSYVIFNITDRFSLRVLSASSFKDVGVYSLGYTITNSVKLVVLSSIWLSVRPLIYKMMDDPNSKRFYSKLMKYMIFSVACLLLVISLFGQEAILIITGSDIYNNSFFLIPIISIALIFDTLKEISQSIGLNIVKKTGIMGILMVVITVLNIIVNILLIPPLGIYGAATSTAISQIIFFFFIYRYAQKYYPVPYEIKKILFMVVILAFTMGISLLTYNVPILVRIPVKVLILISFPIILYYVKFYEEIEITRIKQIWRKWKNPTEWSKIIKDSE